MGCVDYGYFSNIGLSLDTRPGLYVPYSIVLPSTILMSCDERNIIY